jgi:hypothetical protein
MGRLKILASGNSPQAQAEQRGKLFEGLMADVLRQFGYKIDAQPNVNYAGMEIDIEGRVTIGGAPLYAECKCYETDVDCPKLQAFCGKYMSRWLQDKRCQGVFIALPGLNSHAKGFYREYYEQRTDVTLGILEEQDVLDAIFNAQATVPPESVARALPEEAGTPGDWLLLYTDRGLFWVQYVVPPGAAIASKAALFDARGQPLTERASIDYLSRLLPELDDFGAIQFADEPSADSPAKQRELERAEEEIVEVRGSSALFEYQFPASPQYFIGREAALSDVQSFVGQVSSRQTSSRGLLFEANSGWGKSSLVLATAARLRGDGHLVVAIDSRSASSSQFFLRAVDYALKKVPPTAGAESRPIGGFEDAIAVLVEAGQSLEQRAKILLVFLDQFENLFFLPDALRRVRDAFLKICDAQTNVVLGFSWKTDLIGLTSEFPYQARDAISGSSKRVVLETFSEVETNALLDKLAQELHSSLRKDLRFLLSEFSQGYPWLLAKLCAHVKAQREAGAVQVDIASNLLNVEQLFEEDLRGLTAEEEETLRRIAQVAPVAVSDLGDEFKPQVIQALVNRRLLVRIGNKCDVYWDVFRDYLNSGHLPIQENYVLRMQPGSVLKALKLLAEAGGSLPIGALCDQAGLTEKSYYNVARDMRVLGFAKMEDGAVVLQSDLSLEPQNFEESVRLYLRERLQRNRLVQRLMDKLEAEHILTSDDVSELLARSCPYIYATPQTWQVYSRILSDWMDRADLATYHTGERTLSEYSPGREVRERRSLLAARRAWVHIPCVQSEPIARALGRIYDALTMRKRIDWSGFKESTRRKALVSLEDLGFISREKKSIRVAPELRRFVEEPHNQSQLFAERALKMPAFGAFVQILREHENTGASLSTLGAAIRGRLGVDWKDGTAETNAKIMLDWARYAGLAPDAFTRARRRSPPSKDNPPSPQGRFWD